MPQTPFRFGDWRVEPQLNQIARDGEQRQLEPLSMDVLSWLAIQAPRIVNPDELLERFWPGRVLEEGTIHRRINRIRRALGDDPKAPQYIQTIIKRGYRAIAEVEVLEPIIQADSSLLARLDSVTPPFEAYEGPDAYVFVCYAHDDKVVVYQELKRLRLSGINLWYDEGISPGSDWSDEIAKAIDQCDRFLYFVSPASTASRNCRDEVQFALKRHKRVLTVYLSTTELPAALELSMGATQALLRHELDENDYQRKLTKALRSDRGDEDVEQSDGLAIRLTDSRTLTSDGRVGWSRADFRRFRTLLVIVALAFAVALGIFNLPSATDSDPSLFGPPNTLAVLSFRVPDNEPELTSVAEGLADRLSTALFKVPELRIASRVGPGVGRQQGDDFEEIARQLGVRLLLDGSLHRAGANLSLMAQLIDARDGFQLWSDSFDISTSTILDAQQGIARGVVAALGLKAPDSDQDGLISLFGTDNTEAYALALEGFGHKTSSRLATDERTRSAVMQSIGFFERALTLDPRFWPVYEYLAESYAAAQHEYGTVESHRRIRHLLNTAIALGPDPATRRAFNMRLAGLDLDWPRVEALLATDLREHGLPESPYPMGFYGGSAFSYALLLASSDLHEDALQFLNALQPIAASAEAQGMLDQYRMWSLMALGRHAEALTMLADCRSLRNTATWGLPGICLTLRANLIADPVARADAYQTAAAQLDGEYHHLALLRAAIARGQIDIAAQELQTIIEQFPDAHDLILYGQLQFDPDGAFDQHLAAVATTSPMLPTLFAIIEVTQPDLLQHPAYQRFRSAYNLGPEWTEELCRRVDRLTPYTGIEAVCIPATNL